MTQPIKKLFSWIFAAALFVGGGAAFAETIVLKSGKIKQGRIIERTADFVKLSVDGITIPYYTHEIESIQEELTDATAPADAAESATPELADVIESPVMDPADAVEPPVLDAAASTPTIAVNAPQAPLTSQVLPPTGGKSFLWRVRSQDGMAYLLGSIHIGKKEMYPLAPAIEKAFEESEFLVVEIDPRKMNAAAVASKLTSAAVYQSGETLDKHLSNRTRELLAARLAEMGMTTESFQPFKPWFAALQLTGLEIIRMGLDPNFGVDQYFVTKAEGEKDILELESFEFQLELFNGMPEEEQDLLLFYTLKELENTRSGIDQMMQAWLAGDVDKLQREFINKTETEFPELKPFLEKFLYQRNIDMTEKIKAYLHGTQVHFVVVGSAHLVGERGIVALLQKEGYQVEQL